MARTARIEYPGAIYHVINRGNYRTDVFGSLGAAKAFVHTLEEAVKRYRWELGAYVVMRNHFHLALRTPEPNLSAGMHWLQATYATRFNRMRGENGHLFQGRYQALHLENEGVWARVADYIHLNPLRAQVVGPEFLGQFRWSSLRHFAQNQRFEGLNPNGWLATCEEVDSITGWRIYEQRLLDHHAREMQLPKTERESWSVGWAIGSDDWKRSLRKPDRVDASVDQKSEYRDPKELRELRWEDRLQVLLKTAGKRAEDLVEKRQAARWKIGIADRMQRELGVPVVWLAKTLRMGTPASVRTKLWRFRLNVDI